MLHAVRAISAALASLAFPLPVSGAGKVVFSTKPVDPAPPAGLTTSLKGASGSLR